MPDKRARTYLTAMAIEKLRPAKGKRRMVFDAHPGLAVRITPRGSKSFVVVARGPDGRQKWVTLGKVDDLSIHEAREKADEERKRVRKGLRPASAFETSKAPETIAEAVTEYIEKYAKRTTKRWPETERIFRRNVLPLWGPRQLTEITRVDANHLLDPLLARGVDHMANRTHSAIRHLFSWCVDRGYLETNPIAGLKQPAKERARERVLDDDEIVRLWEAWDRMDYPLGPYSKLLLLTAQRRSEVAHMCWCDLDLDPDKRVWNLPGEMTKNGKPHNVPLSVLACEVLEGLADMRFSDTWVFTVRNDKPITGFGDAKRRASDLSGIESDWRLHDLRRTAASGMARLNVAPHVLSKVLNHAPASLTGVTSIYNRYGYEDEKRHALETWGRFVSSLIRRTESSVVEFKLDAS